MLHTLKLLLIVGEKTKWPLNINTLTERPYISSYTQSFRGTHNKNNKKQERPSGKPSVLHVLRKPSNLWESKDLINLSKFGEPLTLSGNKESTIWNVYASHNVNGGIGNKMFKYVSAVSIAHHNNRHVVFNRGMNTLKEIFPKIKLNILNYRPKWEGFFERRHFTFKPEFFNLSKENLIIGKNLFSFKYFQHNFGYIYNKTLSYFNTNLLNKAKGFVQKAMNTYRKSIKIKSNETKLSSICLHVRRGDFLAEKWVRLGFRVPSSLDIQNAIDYFENKFEHTIFIVMSNDLEWCKVILNRTNVYFSPMDSANEDFVLMCSCDHMIMTVGTFGWWGAWFTSWRGGIVMYYEHPFEKNTFFYKSLSRHDYIPSHWLAYTNMTITETIYLGNK